ncbi:MAG: hypothetical protein D6687_08700 [Acidobacteria bacterium]|nr:MAG: hypothetical protein D6687_08700 [Acidobacteriota bacterium]
MSFAFFQPNWSKRHLFGHMKAIGLKVRMKLSKKLAILAGILAVLSASILFYAYYIEPRKLVIRHQSLKVKNWNPQLNGLKIAVMGDIHAGSNYVTEERLREIVEKTNAENPDLIVILGDFLSPGKREFQIFEMPVPNVAENLKGFQAKLGTYAVFGNWDFWAEQNLRREFEKVGIRFLENEVVTLEKNGQKFRIFGLEDHKKFGNWANKTNKWKQILEPTEADGDLIVLEHSPDVLPIITDERLLISSKLRLILAAHTHGGQVWLPLIGSPIVPSSYGQKYSYGHIRENGVDMFVTTGIGTSILPIRFLVPPEIVILEIYADD